MKRVNVSFDEDLHYRFRMECFKQNTSMQEIIISKVREWVGGGVVVPKKEVEKSGAEEQKGDSCDTVWSLEKRKAVALAAQQAAQDTFKSYKTEEVIEDAEHTTIRCQANGCNRVMPCTLVTIELEGQNLKKWICDPCWQKHLKQSHN